MELLCELGITGDDHAADPVRVSVEILGGGVDDEVGAEVDRTLQHRCQECVVDHHERVALAGNSRHGGEVGELHHRVGRGFHENHPSAIGTGVGEGRGFRRVDKDDVDPVALGDSGEEAVCSAVEIIGGNDVVTRFEQIGDRVDRRET